MQFVNFHHVNGFVSLQSRRLLSSGANPAVDAHVAHAQQTGNGPEAVAFQIQAQGLLLDGGGKGTRFDLNGSIIAAISTTITLATVNEAVLSRLFTVAFGTSHRF